MKKITILALHLNYGGVEKYISSLCKMLEDKYEIELIVTYSGIPAFNFSKNIKIKYLINEMPNREKFMEYLKDKKIFKTLLEGFKAIKILYLKRYLNIKTIKNIDSDYIITTRMFHNKLVGKYANENIVKIATEHNYHENNMKYVSKLLKSLDNFDYFITVSKELYDYYVDKVSNAEVIYISNILDFVPNKKSPLKDNNIVSVGRFSKEKCFDDLIDVFKKVNDAVSDTKLYLIGSGDQKDIIKKKVKEYGLTEKVILPGFLPQKDIEKYYLKSKIYVMTSRTESFGLVLIEAMSYGLPCIAFDCASGAREIINKDNGKLINNRDKDKMAKDIVKLLNNSNALNSLSKEAIKTSKTYSMINIKNIWLELLEKNERNL